MSTKPQQEEDQDLASDELREPNTKTATDSEDAREPNTSSVREPNTKTDQ